MEVPNVRHKFGDTRTNVSAFLTLIELTNLKGRNKIKVKTESLHWHLINTCTCTWIFFIEAASNFLPIISSNCPSGPKEILDYGNNGFLYKTNDQSDFLSKLVEYFEMSEKELKDKLFNLNQKIQEYSFENHSKELQKVFKKN